MTIKTFRGQLPIGLQAQLRLSTNDGLTGYRINKFQVVSSDTSQDTYAIVAKIFLTDQTGNISPTIDFNDTDLLGCAYQDSENDFWNNGIIIFDQETFNQDIFISITDAEGGTTPVNYYIELEQMKLDLNHSTYITIKNIRSRTQA